VSHGQEFRECKILFDDKLIILARRPDWSLMTAEMSVRLTVTESYLLSSNCTTAVSYYGTCLSPDCKHATTGYIAERCYSDVIHASYILYCGSGNVKGNVVLLFNKLSNAT
jgi:hypothetical protein